MWRGDDTTILSAAPRLLPSSSGHVARPSSRAVVGPSSRPSSLPLEDACGRVNARWRVTARRHAQLGGARAKLVVVRKFARAFKDLPVWLRGVAQPPETPRPATGVCDATAAEPAARSATSATAAPISGASGGPRSEESAVEAAAARGAVARLVRAACAGCAIADPAASTRGGGGALVDQPAPHDGEDDGEAEDGLKADPPRSLDRDGMGGGASGPSSSAEAGEGGGPCLARAVELRDSFYHAARDRRSHLYRVTFDGKVSNEQAKRLEQRIRARVRRDGPRLGIELREEA